MGRQVNVHRNVGVFVTMNPGYAGRSNLPENLKQLFRQLAMIQPDRKLIAEVMMFSQGFAQAEELAQKTILLFDMCLSQLSKQPHYDFGLRSLKSVLSSAGRLKRSGESDEKQILLRSFNDTVFPKLIQEDEQILLDLIQTIFGVQGNDIGHD